MSELVRVSISIEKPLYERLEKLVRQSGYTNRSEFVRDLVRRQIVQREWDSDREVAGTVTLVYDHHVRGLTDRLTALQHGHRGVVLAATHVHLSHHMCMEVIILRSRASEIRRLADEMRKLRGVLYAELAAASTGEELH